MVSTRRRRCFKRFFSASGGQCQAVPSHDPRSSMKTWICLFTMPNCCSISSVPAVRVVSSLACCHMFPRRAPRATAARGDVGVTLFFFFEDLDFELLHAKLNVCVCVSEKHYIRTFSHFTMHKCIFSQAKAHGKMIF